MRSLLARVSGPARLAILALAALTGPVLAGEPATEPAASESPGTCELVILNDSGRTLIPGKQVVTDNGKRVASLPRQTFTRLQVAPGEHVLRPDPFLWKQEVRLDMAPGSRHYVVVAYRPERSWAAPFAGTPLILRELAEPDALPLLQDMTEK